MASSSSMKLLSTPPRISKPAGATMSSPRRTQLLPARCGPRPEVRRQHAGVLLPRLEDGPEQPHHAVVDRLAGLAVTAVLTPEYRFSSIQLCSAARMSSSRVA